MFFEWIKKYRSKLDVFFQLLLSALIILHIFRDIKWLVIAVPVFGFCGFMSSMREYRKMRSQDEGKSITDEIKPDTGKEESDKDETKVAEEAVEEMLDEIKSGAITRRPIKYALITIIGIIEMAEYLIRVFG